MSDVHDNLAKVTGDMQRRGMEAIVNGEAISGVEMCEYAARVVAAAAAEAAKLIPAERIEFSDERGRRTIAAGWVKPMEVQP